MKKILEALKKAKTNKGFTLVELIIVIAIIAILAAILAPQYVRFIEDSKESNDVAMAASIEDAVNAFAANGNLKVGSTVVWYLESGRVVVTHPASASFTTTKPGLTGDMLLAQLNVIDDGSDNSASTYTAKDLIVESDNARNGFGTSGSAGYIGNTDRLTFTVEKDANDILLVTCEGYVGNTPSGDYDYNVWAD